MMRKVISVGLLFALFALAKALPKDDVSSNEVSRSPALENEPDDDFPSFETTETPFMMRIIGSLGSILSSVMQIPSLMARAFNYLVTTQPFARLREEVRNLNISYPKTGLLF